MAARSDGDEPVRQVAELVLQHIYPELLASTSINTIASVSEHEASTGQHVKSNRHHNHDLKSIWPGGPKQQKRLQREPVPARTRLFPRVAAGVLAALVIIAAMFSWFAVLHRPQVPPSGHPTTIPTSNIATYRAAGGSVYKVAWSPDGTEITSTNAVGLVQIWDTVTGHTISTYRGNFLTVLSLVWSPGHSLLVTAEGADRTVQVWDAGTTRLLYTYPGHTEQVNDVAWSPDGTHIASASDDGTVQVWPSPSSIEIGKLRLH